MKILVSIININTEDQELLGKKENHDLMFNVQWIEPSDQIRISKVPSEIKLEEKLTTLESEYVKELCTEYSAVFYL